MIRCHCSKTFTFLTHLDSSLEFQNEQWAHIARDAKSLPSIAVILYTFTISRIYEIMFNVLFFL